MYSEKLSITSIQAIVSLLHRAFCQSAAVSLAAASEVVATGTGSSAVLVLVGAGAGVSGRSFAISASMLAGVVVDAHRLTTLPFWSIKNFSKFHYRNVLVGVEMHGTCW